MARAQFTDGMADFFSKESLASMFNDEEAALITLHLGITPMLMAFAVKCAKLLSEFLDQLSYGLVREDKIYPSLPPVFFGVNDINAKLTHALMHYIALAKNRRDGTGLLIQGEDVIGEVVDGEIEVPLLPDELWLNHPEVAAVPDAADGEPGGSTLMIFPALSPCHPDCTGHTTCGEGVMHKGLFYLDNAAERMRAFSAALKENGINAKRRERMKHT